MFKFHEHEIKNAFSVRVRFRAISKSKTKVLTIINNGSNTLLLLDVTNK